MDKLNDLLKEYSHDLSVEELDSLKVLRGFIQWLVDNDKIDRDSEDYPIKRNWPYFDDDILAIVSQNCNSYEDYYKICYDKYESLLMLLSIQDSPIDFLCSVLK